MITYKSKIVTYLSLVLLGYLLFQRYNEHKNEAKGYDGSFKSPSNKIEAKYTIKIDEDKKYQDFTFIEKLVYKFIKNDLPTSVRNKIESSKVRKNNQN